MKKFLMTFLAVGFFTVAAHAIEPVTTRPGNPESRYTISQSTVSFSSSTVTTIAALTSYNGVIEGYRKIIIRDLTGTTSFFYRLDGSTQSIATVGMLNNTTETATIETSGAVNILLAPGVAAKVFNILTFQK